jgi:diguanylate cyclase (GGDEF)-like protein
MTPETDPAASEAGGNEWFREAIEAAGDAVYDWDLASGAIRWAGSGRALFGDEGFAAVPSAEALANRINVEDLPVRVKALADHFERDLPYDCEYRLRLADGNFCWVHDRGAKRRDGEGGPRRLVGTVRRISERKQNETQIERRVNFDELTGHYGTARLRDALEFAVGYATRYNTAGAYLVVGVDRLVQINNSFGYDVGDAVLVGVGRRLEQCIRSTDVIGRIGADRFGVVLNNCSPEQLTLAAERILNSVRGQPIMTPQTPVHVTVSVGGIGFPGVAGTAYELMLRAETALKEAKQQGRDCFIAFRRSDQQESIMRRGLTTANQVHMAMKENRLVFAYQPIVRSSDQRTEYFECLLRMRESNGDLVPAGAFIPVIEQLGLARSVDRHVLEMAVTDLESDPALKLAFNISGLTASDRAWLRTLIALLRGRPEMAERVVIEVTETAALHDIEETSRFISAVRDLGCRVALDDFGAGFTSFRHLRALAIDIVKIDGSFVRNLVDNVDNQLFIRNLLGLANAFNLTTVAECVETADEASFLIEEGVQYLQGYYFGRPALDRAANPATGLNPANTTAPAAGAPKSSVLRVAG